MHRRAGRTNELCWSCPTRTTEGCSEWPAPLGLCSARREEGRQHPCTGGHFSSVSVRLCVSPGTTGLAISLGKTNFPYYLPLPPTTISGIVTHFLFWYFLSRCLFRTVIHVISKKYAPKGTEGSLLSHRSVTMKTLWFRIAMRNTQMKFNVLSALLTYRKSLAYTQIHVVY